MKTMKCEIPSDVGYVIPISDIHYGDKAFTKKSKKVLLGNLEWVKNRENARIVLVGDLFNGATRDSKTAPFDQPDSEFEEVLDIFRPYKDKIVTAIDGNHEARLEDFANFSIMNAFCMNLGIPYSHLSVAINFKVNKRPDDKRFRQSYIGYFHHTTGGGKTMGSKLNRVEEMTKLLSNADFYVGAHHHGLISSPIVSNEFNRRTNKVEQKRQQLVGAGGYLEWNESYAERMMLRPVKIGSPRIRLDGNKKDIHVSI